MAKFGLVLDLTGTDDFARAAIDFGVASIMLKSDVVMGAVVQNVAEYIMKNIELQYETAGQHQSGGFEGLSDDYREAKAGGYASKDQVNTNDQPDLMLSMAYKNSWRMDQLDSESIKIFSELEDTKHSWHEFGEGKMPLRPVLVLTDKDIEVIDEIFQNRFDSTIMMKLSGVL
jgi:hypothetical protein